MTIRTYQPGDEVGQAEIYNEAAAALPKFKPATPDEVGRRCQSADFDPGTRFYAEEAGKLVAYATFQANGRVSYPWCRKGHEHHADPLAQAVLQAMTERGIVKAFAAYRADWTEQFAFWERRGFRPAREMINYMLTLADMPTRSPRPTVVTILRREEIAAIHAMAPSLFRVTTPAELERHIFQNPYYPSSAYFVLRNRETADPLALGIVVLNPKYADPTQVDPAMPCFRLGAFGTEGTTTKRLNGLFSFVAPNNTDLMSHGMLLLEYAAARLEAENLYTLAAQVPSDVPHLARFYKQLFQRQGAFPVYEKELTALA